MNKKFYAVLGVSVLAGSFLLTCQAIATEGYDAKAFGPETPIVWDKPTKVVFEHKSHTDDIGLECSACHDDIFAMQRGVAMTTGKLTMASLTEGKFCGACHDGDTAFATDTNCTACHIAPKGDITWEDPSKVVFGHGMHVNDLGLECVACHDSLFTMKLGAATDSGTFTMAAFAEGKHCGACHDGDTAFATDSDCTTCHSLPEGNAPMVWTKPVKAVAFYHKTHVEDYGLECSSCHDGTFAMKKGAAEHSDDFTMESLYTGKYCGKCHDGNTAFASNTLCTNCHIGTNGYKRMTGETSHTEEHGGH
jgi:c(7)-type cytochrome triheme protein